MKTLLKCLMVVFIIIAIASGVQSGRWVVSLFIIFIIGLMYLAIFKTVSKGTANKHADADGSLWSGHSSLSDNSCDGSGDSGGGD